MKIKTLSFAQTTTKEEAINNGKNIKSPKKQQELKIPTFNEFLFHN